MEGSFWKSAMASAKKETRVGQPIFYKFNDNNKRKCVVPSSVAANKLVSTIYHAGGIFN